MKLFLFITAAFGLSLPVFAEGNFGIHAAYWNPEDAGSEIGFGLRFKTNVTPQWGLEFRSAYFEFEENVGFDAKAELEVIPLEAGFVMNFPVEENFTAYLGAGIGYYLMDLEWRGPEGTLSPSVDNEIGFYAVAGADVFVSESIGIFAEVKYTWLEIDNIGGFETNQDNILDGFGGNLGLVFRW